MRTTITLAAAVGALLVATVAPHAWGSSHREAPFITEMPKVDGTDFYLFRSYEPGRDGFVTLIANYHPLQDPYGGPNYFTLDPAARYRINVENSGDGVEDIVFEFKFKNILSNQPLPVGGVDVPHPLRTILPLPPVPLANETELYTVSVIRGGGPPRAATNRRTGNIFFAKALDYFGEKTFADYEAYAQSRITPIQIPGCDDGKVFVGQRKESFAVNLGEVFDLINLNPVGPENAKPSVTDDKNITALALELPIDCLQGQGDVIGGWTTALLPRFRALRDNPTFADPADVDGDFVQVSRLGMPLVNEVVIGLPDKNRFNASRPDGDLDFATYVTNPTLAEIIQILFPVQAPNNFPRGDLLATFVTGIPGLNEFGFGEMQRLNTAIAPTPKSQQSRLGVIGGDLAGFPNGRRPGDDVVDIELRVVMGILCHPLAALGGLDLGLCDPADAPDGLLPYTDQTFQGPDQFDNTFPYLRTPLPGSPNLGGAPPPPPPPGAGDGKMWSASLTSPGSNATGKCVGVLEGSNFSYTCVHNLANPIDIVFGIVGQAGPGFCPFPGQSPVQATCPLGPGGVTALQNGDLVSVIFGAGDFIEGRYMP